MKNRILLFLLLFTSSFFIAASNQHTGTTNLLFQLISSIRQNNYECFKKFMSSGIDLDQHYSECEYKEWATKHSSYRMPFGVINDTQEQMTQPDDCSAIPNRIIYSDIFEFTPN